MSELRLRAEQISVIRCRSTSRAAYYAMIDSAADLLSGRRKRTPRTSEFYALQDVHLELSAGEALGVIGANGAGKSTLLKVLAGMLGQSAGSVTRCGRVEPVIEIGSSLNPFLTGRENATLEGMLKGMSAERLRSYVLAVSEFADLGASFEQPVSSYSSGMAARLSFAVAAMTKPDVLLIDEALAVGDLAFQRQCGRFIENFLKAGGSVLLVSHNLVQVQNICSRAMLLDQGRLVFAGTAVEAVRAMVRRTGAIPTVSGSNAPLWLDRFGPVGSTAQTGENTELVVRYWLDDRLTDVTWGFEIWSVDGQICVTAAQQLKPQTLPRGSGTLSCIIERLPLAPGTYCLRLNVVDGISGTPILLAGFGGPAIIVEVASPPSISSNYQIENGQIAVIDVSWQPASGTVAPVVAAR